ncbi:MAG: SAM-dependent DNA methyltransferase, partial [candidate division Zixibacteria bacterium]|nr:SAM-dependent DNA methyltransferase [candidate division Zixibacteria bacterium]
MKSCRKTAAKTEFGDGQTPGELAALVCATVSRRIQPASVFEPNCGEGTFLQAAIHTFPTVQRILGLEVNRDYVLRSQSISHASLNVIHGDFFDYQWTKDIEQLPDPLLVLGNPPWVTNSDLMRL